MPKLRKPVPIERADQHLDEVSDVITLILKGHLLVEEALYAAVQTQFSNPQYLIDANLRFAQLLSIAKGFFFTNEHAPMWNAIQTLNSLRNRLAHKLEVSVSAEELQKICFLLPMPKNAALDHPDIGNLLNGGLATILGSLWALPIGITDEG
jgi:hypothetical protein